MAVWVRHGRRPRGDEVLDAATVAAPTYGCGFSRAARGDDAPLVRQLRTRLPACPAGSTSAGF
jgi:hypothetical protein